MPDAHRSDREGAGHLAQWKALTHCVQSVWSTKPSGNNIVYGYAEQMMVDCVHQKWNPRDFADMLRNNIRSFCMDAALQMHQLDTGTNWEAGLQVISTLWTSFRVGMRSLSQIFDGLESRYLIPRAIGSLWDVGLDVFRESIAMRGVGCISPAIKYVSLALDAYRSSDLNLGCDWEVPSVPQPILLALQMFTVLHEHKCQLERTLIEDAETFYARIGQPTFSETPLADHLALLECRAKLETELSKHIEEKISKCLVARFTQLLLLNHTGVLLQSDALVKLFATSNKMALSRLDNLFTPIDQNSIRDAWHRYIKEKGAFLLGAEEDGAIVVDRLLTFKDDLDAIANTCFKGNNFYAPREAFESFLNDDPSRAAMILASAFSLHLESDLTREKLKRLMTLFRHILAKDIFEAHYRKDLHIRILSRGKVTDQDMEVGDALRADCGSSFTTKIDGMMRDVLSSTKEYGQMMQEDEYARTIEFAPLVLATGVWPTVAGPSATDWTADIPYVGPSIAKIQRRFKELYAAKNSDRMLNWIPIWGTCVVKAVFNSGKKYLLLSHAQACILLCFQEVDTLPFSVLNEAGTNIGEHEVKKTIQSLCLQKNLKIIVKSTKRKVCEEGETFTFNSGFKHSKNTLVLNNPPSQTSKEEIRKIEERAEESRQFELDAMIVRIMKSAKTLTHNELLAQVLKLSSFRPQPADVRKRVDALLAREYISSNPTQPDCYNYVA